MLRQVRRPKVASLLVLVCLVRGQRRTSGGASRNLGYGNVPPRLGIRCRDEGISVHADHCGDCVAARLPKGISQLRDRIDARDPGAKALGIKGEVNRQRGSIELAGRSPEAVLGAESLDADRLR